MQIKRWNTKMWKVKSEKGFTFLELVMVMVVTGILSSTLILPFTSSMKQATLPEVYNTAAYIALGELETIRGNSYSVMKLSVGSYVPGIPTHTVKGRVYNVAVDTAYVSYSDGSFNTSITPTELIMATAIVSNTGITDISMSEILTDDFFD